MVFARFLFVGGALRPVIVLQKNKEVQEQKSFLQKIQWKLSLKIRKCTRKGISNNEMHLYKHFPLITLN